MSRLNFREKGEALHRTISRKSLRGFQDMNRYIEIFELACLLHDVRCAPFSHTGEGFCLYL